MGESYLLEVVDKSGRKIHLTRERWSHIRKDHPEVELEEIEQCLIKPAKIMQIQDDKYYYFCYLKNKKLPKKFLRVIVKYKNGVWLIMTAHFVSHIS